MTICILDSRNLIYRTHYMHISLKRGNTTVIIQTLNDTSWERSAALSPYQILHTRRLHSPSSSTVPVASRRKVNNRMEDADVVAAEIATVPASSEPSSTSRRSNTSSMHSGARDRCEPAGWPLTWLYPSTSPHEIDKIWYLYCCCSKRCGNSSVFILKLSIYLAEPCTCTTRAQRFCFRGATDSTSYGSTHHSRHNQSFIFLPFQKKDKATKNALPGVVLLRNPLA